MKDDELKLTEEELTEFVEALDVAEKKWEEDKKLKAKDKIILFSTHCPLCKGVELKLKAKNIPYRLITNEEEMKKIGLKSAPALSVNGQIKIGKEIFEFINNYRG